MERHSIPRSGSAIRTYARRTDGATSSAQNPLSGPDVVRSGVTLALRRALCRPDFDLQHSEASEHRRKKSAPTSKREEHDGSSSAERSRIRRYEVAGQRLRCRILNRKLVRSRRYVGRTL